MPMRPSFLSLSGLCSALMLCVSGMAHAESVALVGMMGQRPLLVVNGSSPRAMSVGETFQGVRVVSVSGSGATLASAGKRYTLRVGDAPVNVGQVASAGGASGPDGGRIVLPRGSGGHFYASGTVNGKSARFVVDTGATLVAMGVPDAERMGIAYRNGRPSRSLTANGVVESWRVQLNSVRINSVEVYNVDAVVLKTSMPAMLLGNSFLSRFRILQNGDQMVLERRY